MAPARAVDAAVDEAAVALSMTEYHAVTVSAGGTHNLAIMSTTSQASFEAFVAATQKAALASL